MSHGTKETFGAFLERKAAERARENVGRELRIEAVRPRSVKRAALLMLGFPGVRYAIITKGGRVLRVREDREEALELAATTANCYLYDCLDGRAFAVYYVEVGPRGSFGE